MSTLRKSYKLDLYRYFGDTGMKSFIKALFFMPGFRFTYFLRKAANAKQSKSLFSVFYLVLHRIYAVKYSIDIPVSTSIGEGLYIGHMGNVVVSVSAQIGKNCNIAQGVTIGRTSRGSKEGAPTIGNSVWIGANAVVVGKIAIGDNVMIAPLTFVNMDIPANSIVSGNPAQIRSQEDATAGYVMNKVDL